MLKINQNYFLKKFLQKKSDFFLKFSVFKVIFAPEIFLKILKKKVPTDRPDLDREVRPPVKQGVFSSPYIMKMNNIFAHHPLPNQAQFCSF